MSCYGHELFEERNNAVPEFDERTFDILKEIFGSIAEESVIRKVLSYCQGNLSHSIDYLMKITNSNELNLNGDTVVIDKGSDQNTLQSEVTRDVDNLSFSSRLRNPTKNKTSKMDLREAKSSTQPQPEIPTYLKNAIDDINNGYRVCILMRGLPGSGKSTLARQIIDITVKDVSTKHIFSTDDFFMVNNNYKYDKSRLGDAHTWNQNRVKQKLCNGFSPIIIDNTNVELWSMQLYVINAVENGYILHVLEPQTSWAYKAKKLFTKNSHQVPLFTINRMLEQFQKNITAETLFNFFKLQYPPGLVPPVYRKLPKLAPNQVEIGDLIDFSVPQVKENDMFQSKKPAEFPNSPSWQPRNSGFSSIVTPTNTNRNNNPSPIRDWDDISGQSAKRDLDVQQKISQIAGPMSDCQISDKYSEVPKPQRCDSKKSGKQTLFSSESIDWEPINSSMSEWVCVTEPVRNSSLSSEYWNNLSTKDVCDASTNTLSSDIMPDNLRYFNILTPVSRDINSLFIFPDKSSPRLKVALDKGTMTCDDEELSGMEGGSKDNIESLKNMRVLFDDIPEDYLLDILDQCNGDMNWAVGILLDGKTENGLLPKMQHKIPSEETAVPVLETQAENAVSLALQTDTQNENIPDNFEEKNVEIVETASQPNTSISETSINLKKQIEENFVFSDAYYSEHVMKLRRKIHGDKILPQTSIENEKKEKATDSTDSVLGTSNRTHRDSSEEEDEQNIISVTVGNEFIANLHNIFGSCTVDHNWEPVIHMPFSLLSQIHALWLESLYNQIDVQKEYLKAIIKEDEDFARQLLTKEKEAQRMGEVPVVPNLREIMDMEVALAQYKTNISEWKKETPDDLASRLTRQKLIQLFPDIDPEVLLEVLNAHNNNFEQTCQVLLVSTGKIPMTHAEDESKQEIQKILMEQEKDLLARANKEQLKVMASEGPTNLTPGIDENTIKNYRDEAVKHLEIRNIYHNKAKEYFKKGMTQTASYYSQLAALHTRKHDYINSLAASEIMEANTSKKDAYTLDLHSLYVAEACQVLDMFLDKHIHTLREKNKHQNMKLFLITGRGLHSPRNHPRIKPAVITRLNQRDIRYYEVNPGLLGIYLNSQHLLTDSSEANN